MSTTATAPRYEIGQQVRIVGLRSVYRIARRRCLAGHWDYHLVYGPTDFAVAWTWESMLEAAS